MVTKH